MAEKVAQPVESQSAVTPSGSQAAPLAPAKAPPPPKAPAALKPKAPAPSQPPKQVDPHAVLLALSDLPAGWSSIPVEDVENTEEEDPSQPCNQQPRGLVAKSDAEADFQVSDSGPFLSHLVEVYNPGDAQKSIDAELASVESCPEWTETDEEGTEYKFQIQPLTFPGVGDQSIAYRVNMEVEGTTVVFDVVMFRRADVAETVVYGAVGSVNSAETERFVLKADAKLKTAM